MVNDNKKTFYYGKKIAKMIILKDYGERMAIKKLILKRERNAIWKNSLNISLKNARKEKLSNWYCNVCKYMCRWYDILERARILRI